MRWFKLHVSPRYRWYSWRLGKLAVGPCRFAYIVYDDDGGWIHLFGNFYWLRHPANP